jgi:hypothetical protein
LNSCLMARLAGSAWLRVCLRPSIAGPSVTVYRLVSTKSSLPERPLRYRAGSFCTSLTSRKGQTTKVSLSCVLRINHGFIRDLIKIYDASNGPLHKLFACEHDETAPSSGVLKSALSEVSRSRVAFVLYPYECIHLSCIDCTYRDPFQNKP